MCLNEKCHKTFTVFVSLKEECFSFLSHHCVALCPLSGLFLLRPGYFFGTRPGLGWLRIEVSAQLLTLFLSAPFRRFRFPFVQHLCFIFFGRWHPESESPAKKNDEIQMLHNTKAKTTKWHRQGEYEKLRGHVRVSWAPVLCPSSDKSKVRSRSWVKSEAKKKKNQTKKAI